MYPQFSPSLVFDSQNRSAFFHQFSGQKPSSFSTPTFWALSLQSLAVLSQIWLSYPAWPAIYITEYYSSAFLLPSGLCGVRSLPFVPTVLPTSRRTSTTCERFFSWAFRLLLCLSKLFLPTRPYISHMCSSWSHLHHSVLPRTYYGIRVLLLLLPHLADVQEIFHIFFNLSTQGN